MESTCNRGVFEKGVAEPHRPGVPVIPHVIHPEQVEAVRLKLFADRAQGNVPVGGRPEGGFDQNGRDASFPETACRASQHIELVAFGVCFQKGDMGCPVCRAPRPPWSRPHGWRWARHHAPVFSACRHRGAVRKAGFPAWHPGRAGDTSPWCLSCARTSRGRKQSGSAQTHAHGLLEYSAESRWRTRHGSRPRPAP